MAEKGVEEQVLAMERLRTIYTDIKYNVPAGKYLLSIKGYTRKEQQKFPTPNCGFFFSFTEVDSFEGFKNPRESDEYDFNLGSIK